MTSALRAILAAMATAGDHLSAEALTARVQATHPDVRASTVYRFLDVAEELGVVDQVLVGQRRLATTWSEPPTTTWCARTVPPSSTSQRPS